MGQKQVQEVPQQPPKPMKELVKDYTKEIQRARRDFRKETFKLEFSMKKLKAELEQKIKKNQSMNAKRIVAQNILRNQRYLDKYANLDGQMQGMIFTLNNMAATATMKDVMIKMTGIMKETNSSLNVKDIQTALMQFENENERANVLNGMIEDALAGTDSEIEDEEADKLISDMEPKGPGNGIGIGIKQPNQIESTEDYQKMMQRINNI